MNHDRISSEEIVRLLEVAKERGYSFVVLERLNWFLKFAENKSISAVCDHFKISRSTFYRWARRFDAKDLNSLEDQPKSFPDNLRNDQSHNKVADESMSIVRKEKKSFFRVTRRMFKTIGLSLFGVMVAVNVTYLVIENKSYDFSMPLTAQIFLSDESVDNEIVKISVEGRTLYSLTHAHGEEMEHTHSIENLDDLMSHCLDTINKYSNAENQDNCYVVLHHEK